METFYELYALVIYIVSAVTFYKLSEKAGVKNSWLAFIPVLQFILFFHIINKSAWNILLMLIPIANIVLLIVWYVKFIQAYGLNGAFVLLMFIPFALFVLMLYMAFSNDVKYVLQGNKYTA